MAEPTLEDAMHVLTDPDNVQRFPDATDGLAQLNVPAVMKALAELGADSETARALAIDALGELGGTGRVIPRQGGLRPDGPRKRGTDDWWLPMTALRL